MKERVCARVCVHVSLSKRLPYEGPRLELIYLSHSTAKVREEYTESLAENYQHVHMHKCASWWAQKDSIVTISTFAANTIRGSHVQRR